MTDGLKGEKDMLYYNPGRFRVFLAVFSFLLMGHLFIQAPVARATVYAPGIPEPSVFAKTDAYMDGMVGKWEISNNQIYI